MQRGSEDEIARGKEEWIRGQMEEWLENGERERGATDGEGGEGGRRCQEGEEAQRGWLILH